MTKMAKNQDWTSEGCGLTWRKIAADVENFHAILKASGVSRADAGRYENQSAEVEGGSFHISGGEILQLYHDDGATWARTELGQYKSPAEARIAAAVFAFREPDFDEDALLLGHGYATEAPEGGVRRHWKAHGPTNASVTIQQDRIGRTTGKRIGSFVSSHVAGARSKSWPSTAMLHLSEPRGGLKGLRPEADLRRLAVLACVALNEARLARPARQRAKPLADGEEQAVIAGILSGASVG